MSFKTKNRKKLVADTRVTLHAKHESKVNYFQEKKKDLETKKNDLNILVKRFEEKYQDKEIDECDIDKKMELLDNINKLKKTILNIESNREEIDYLLDTGNILFNYADNSVNNTPIKKTTVNNFRKKIAEKSVMEYFNNNSKIKKEPEKQEQELEKIKLDTESTYKSKAKMYEDYLLLTDENFDNLNIEKTKTVDFCEMCNIEKTLYMSEGKMICSGCGDETFILIDSDKPSYKEPPREISYFAYKRINHFNEWLAQFQAKESTDIPQDVYNQIISELKKERIEDMKTLTPHK